MKDLKYYMDLNYDVVIHKFSEKEGGGYRASIPFLGEAAFTAVGDTVEEALKNLENTKKEIFSYWIKTNTKIEEPKSDNPIDYSGKFIVRVPAELHRKLAIESQNQNISFNSYINYLLSTNLTIDLFYQKMQRLVSSSFNEAIKSFVFEQDKHYNKLSKFCTNDFAA